MHNPTNAILAAIQGSPAGILLILLAHSDRTLGETQIAAIANRSPKTTRSALATLDGLGLAQRHARYHGWTATNKVRQLILGEIPTPEREKLPLPPGSSSDPPRDPDTPSYTTTTTTNERENLPLPWADCHQLLTHACASTPIAATQALTAAHHRRQHPDQIRYQILAWLSYCLSTDGTGINNKGAFIAKQIRHDIPCPHWHTPQLDGDLGHELRRLNYQQLGFNT